MLAMTPVERLGWLKETLALAETLRYDELLPSTVESRIGDAAVRLLSIETILGIKRASPRPKDQAVVPILEAVSRRCSP